jgi:hypothetical protein
MLKRLSTMVLVLVLVPVLINAQERVAKKAPIFFNEPSSTIETFTQVKVGDGTVSAPWVAVDTMANAYGPAIAALNPIAYDPDADVVAVVYRGRTTYSLGSGQLWYSISTDGGAGWSRIAAVNNADLAARYPSMAIQNSGGGLDATTGLFTWPQLNPGAFGFLGYGAAQPLGDTQNPNFYAINQGPPDFSSQVPCWTSGTKFLWASDNGTDAAIDIFVTEDFQTINKTTIPSSAFDDGGNITMGGAHHNGIHYYGVLGTYPDPDTANPISSGWYPGYFKSTDDFATYTTHVADFRTIPALQSYERLFDYKKGDAFVSYEADINVDKNGYVHMMVALSDTNVANKNSIVELFETATGWDAKIVLESIPDNFFGAWFTADNSAGLGQMGPSHYLGMDKSKEYLFTAWSAPASPADTVADIFYSWRKLDGEWSTPVNITNSPNINECGIHLAPTLKYDAGANELTGFVGYWYGSGIEEPTFVTTGPTVFYVAPIKVEVPNSIYDGDNLITFELGQNYPNPFNPTTTINFTITEKSNVSLKVFDVLGREVMTLVNSTKDAGPHQVSFDAGDLASGLYIYTIKAGNFTSSKKMMLMK